MVEVSAKTKKNLPRLLEMILLVADLRELKADPDAPGSGTVLESRMDKGRGPVATVLVQNGTLNVGDVFIVGAVYGKVRAMFDDRGHSILKAVPSTPVEVLGLQGVPEAGDQFQVADEAKARHIVEYRQAKQREAALAKTASSGRLTLDQLHEQLRAGEVKELPVVVKADVQGSVEVLNEMLPKLSNDQVKLKVMQASVGAVTESDVILASASNADGYCVQRAAGAKGFRAGAARGRGNPPAHDHLRIARRAAQGRGRIARAGDQGNLSGTRRSPRHVPREGLRRSRAARCRMESSSATRTCACCATAR
jgi:translation initiation factor IF-2